MEQKQEVKRVGKQAIVKVAMNLTTDEQRETWENVRAHYGKEYSNSAVLYDLVRIKSYEANGQRSNRDRLNDLDREVAELKVMVKAIYERGGRP